MQDITEVKERMEINEFQLTRMKLIVHESKIALWDMQIAKGNDPMNPNNNLTWTAEFRKMLGYSGKIDFPDVLNSCATKPEKLHSMFNTDYLKRTGNTVIIATSGLQSATKMVLL